jgi:hypothetical protein
VKALVNKDVVDRISNSLSLADQVHQCNAWAELSCSEGVDDEDVVKHKSEFTVTCISAPSSPLLEQKSDAVKAFVNVDVVGQKSSAHCHSQISSTNANA